MPNPPFKRGEQLTADRLNRTLAPLDRMVAAGAEVGKEREEYTAPRPSMRVKLTARGSAEGFFEFTEVRYDPSQSGYPVRTGGATHEEMGECVARGRFPDDTAGMGLTYVGMVVLIEPGDQTDSQGRTLWEFTPPPLVMPVAVTKVGGSDGSYTGAATWTYDVYAEDGEKILSAASPSNARPAYGSVTPATRGYVEYRLILSVMTLRLGFVDEVPNYTTATLMSNARYDATTHKFQMKTTMVRVPAVGTESSWTDWTGDQPVAQDIVDDVTYSTSSHKLEQDKRTSAYILEAGANSDNNLIDTAESC